MTNQVVYKSNLDYEDSYSQILKTSLFVVDKTEKGLIWAKFKDTATVFLISPNGMIQVKWNNVEEKKVLLRILRNCLSAKNGEKLQITPTRQQLALPYPPPENFKLYWCNEETEYTQKHDSAEDKKHRRILELMLDDVRLHEEMGFTGTALKQVRKRAQDHAKTYKLF